VSQVASVTGSKLGYQYSKGFLPCPHSAWWQFFGWQSC